MSKESWICCYSLNRLDKLNYEWCKWMRSLLSNLPVIKGRKEDNNTVQISFANLKFWILAYIRLGMQGCYFPYCIKTNKKIRTFDPKQR